MRLSYESHYKRGTRSEQSHFTIRSMNKKWGLTKFAAGISEKRGALIDVAAILPHATISTSSELASSPELNPFGDQNAAGPSLVRGILNGA